MHVMLLIYDTALKTLIIHSVFCINDQVFRRTDLQRESIIVITPTHIPKISIYRSLEKLVTEPQNIINLS